MRRTLLGLGLSILVASSAAAATSSVKIATAQATRKLPSVTATRLVLNDGTTKMYLLFAEKPPTDVVLVDSTGNEGLSLAAWTTSANATALKISFAEGDEENYSLTIHDGPDMLALGGHRSGEGIRGPFKELVIKGDNVRGTLQSEEGPTRISGTFDTPFTTLREPKPISGAAIAESPQGKALLAYANAMRKLDFVTATKYSMNDEVAETKKMDPKMMKTMIKREFGTAAEFDKLLATSAVMTGEGSEYHIRITRKDASGSETSSFGLKLVDGAWKVNY